MSLLDVLRSGVEIANQVTHDLQAVVRYRRSLGKTEYGEEDFALPVLLHAIVDWKRSQLRTTSGELTVSRISITLLDIAEVVAATQGEGIGDDDEFTMADGTTDPDPYVGGSTGPILDLSGFIDAGTNHPIATEVFLG